MILYFHHHHFVLRVREKVFLTFIDYLDYIQSSSFGRFNTTFARKEHHVLNENLAEFHSII